MLAASLISSWGFFFDFGLGVADELCCLLFLFALFIRFNITIRYRIYGLGGCAGTVIRLKRLLCIETSVAITTNWVFRSGGFLLCSKYKISNYLINMIWYESGKISRKLPWNGTTDKTPPLSCSQPVPQTTKFLGTHPSATTTTTSNITPKPNERLGNMFLLVKMWEAVCAAAMLPLVWGWVVFYT